MDILIAIILGAIAGWLAGLIMGTKGGLILNIVLGIVGGAVGKFVLGIVGIGGSGYIGTILVAVFGACLLVWLIRKILKINL